MKIVGKFFPKFSINSRLNKNFPIFPHISPYFPIFPQIDTRHEIVSSDMTTALDEGTFRKGRLITQKISARK